MGSRTTLQRTLDMFFISVSPYLRFDLKNRGSRAILSAMSSDLSLCFSHSFLSSLKLGTQLLKAGRTLMLSLKLMLAWFVESRDILCLLKILSPFLWRARGKCYPFPMVLLSCMFYTLLIWDTLRNTTPTDSCPLNVLQNPSRERTFLFWALTRRDLSGHLTDCMNRSVGSLLDSTH